MNDNSIIPILKYVLEGSQNIPEDLKKVIDYFKDCGNKNYDVQQVKKSIIQNLKDQNYQGKEFIHLDDKNLKEIYVFLPISVKNSILRINKLVSNPENNFNKSKLGIHTLGLAPLASIPEFNKLDYGNTTWNSIKVFDTSSGFQEGCPVLSPEFNG